VSSSLAPVRVPPLDQEARRAAAAHQDQLTKPRGSLGALETLVVDLAAFQGAPLPSARPAAAILFAADHPVTRHGVSAYPAAVTAAMVQNFLSGGAAAYVLSMAHGIPLTVVDVGVATAYEVPARLAPGVAWHRDPAARDTAGDLRSEDAMSAETYARALAAGRSAVEALAPETRIVLLGEMGIGNTTAAAAVSAALLDQPASAMVGAGTGVQGEALERKRAAVEDALRRTAGERDPHRIVQRLGGREIAALLGAAARAVERRMAVLVDGFVVSAAMLALVKLAPEARSGLFFAHRSEEQAHGRVLEAMNARPLLDLGMRLGEASGALCAWPLVDMACQLHARMATFASAGVPGPVE
jgi:nicotinate-nucleotide--dimethylbenzimidazole phosphoribosyltransferase